MISDVVPDAIPYEMTLDAPEKRIADVFYETLALPHPKHRVWSSRVLDSLAAEEEGDTSLGDLRVVVFVVRVELNT